MKYPTVLTLSRRAHLQTLIATAAVAVAPGRLDAQGDPGAGTPVFKHLDDEQAATLLAVSRTLFPHEMLPNRFYWPAVTSIDGAMADEETADRVRAALATLGARFADRDQAAREAGLAGLEGGPFFTLVYAETINGLYLNEEVWRLFGYEGSSVEHGGYLERGFDRIDWLPAEDE
jgi:hypothetical protein